MYLFGMKSVTSSSLHKKKTDNQCLIILCMVSLCVYKKCHRHENTKYGFTKHIVLKRYKSTVIKINNTNRFVIPISNI